MGLTPRRLASVVLLALAYAPLHRLLDPRRTGLAGLTTRQLSENLWQAAWWGTLVAVALTAALARLSARDPWSRLRPLAARLARVPRGAAALGIGTLGFVIATCAALVLFHRTPTSVDSMVMLAHARALVAGRVVLPTGGTPAAWLLQNSWIAAGGMASVYPPGQLLALAVGLSVGAAWLVGPLATGGTAAFAFLAVDRALPERPLHTRLAGFAVAVSPFVWLVGGSHLSHTSAAAAAALLAWSALEARRGGAGWAALAGTATGALVCIRPWTGVVLGCAVLGAAWRQPSAGGLRGGRRVLALVAGGAPWAALLFVWNARLFGSPLRLGYSSAFGPAHGLGWHRDPWGNAYGVVEALAYTGSDVVQLGATLFETPLPAVAAVAVALWALPRQRGMGVLWAWALAPLAANALYWHHGQHLGPRMLYEAAPAWAALTVLLAAQARSASSGLPAWATRAAGWAVLVCGVGAAALVPASWSAARIPPGALSASTLPVLPADEPALLFAHGSWAARQSARLAAVGMRRDSVETLLRRNDACTVDRYVRWRAGRAATGPPVALEPEPGVPAHLEARTLSPGNRVFVDPAVDFDEPCRREAAADRHGTVELEPLLWRAPPLPGARVVVARDLGPVENGRARAAFPELRAWVVIPGTGGRPLRALPYDEGMELLWRGAAALSADGG